jgi:hypothetical protein
MAVFVSQLLPQIHRSGITNQKEKRKKSDTKKKKRLIMTGKKGTGNRMPVT